MRGNPVRSHSTASTMTAASNLSRPMSRQSTASVASNNIQAIPQQPLDQPFNMQQNMPSALWLQHEETVAQHLSQSQQFQTNKAFTVPRPMSAQNMMPFGSSAPFAQVANMQQARSNSFTPAEGRETPIMDINMEDQSQIDGNNEIQPNKPRRGAATTQANDNELRRLLRENQGRSLPDIAKQINKDDSGSKQEKDKQIFGMLWYKQ